MFSRQEIYGIPIWCIRCVAALSLPSTLSFRMPIHFRCGTANISHTQHHMVNSITRKTGGNLCNFHQYLQRKKLVFLFKAFPWCCTYLWTFYYRNEREAKKLSHQQFFIAIVISSWIVSGLEWLFCANAVEAKCLCNGRCRYQKILDSYLYWTSKSFQG